MSGRTVNWKPPLWMQACEILKMVGERERERKKKKEKKK
jgi:hypothetical protein